MSFITNSLRKEIEIKSFDGLEAPLRYTLDDGNTTSWMVGVFCDKLNCYYDPTISNHYFIHKIVNKVVLLFCWYKKSSSHRNVILPTYMSAFMDDANMYILFHYTTKFPF